MEIVDKDADSMLRTLMANWFGSRIVSQRENPRSIAVGHLKRCPLCGALNSKRNAECFVCRWHGDFDHDPASIDQGLNDLLERCPELASAMSEPGVPRRSFKRSVFHFLGLLFRRRLDMRA